MKRKSYPLEVLEAWFSVNPTEKRKLCFSEVFKAWFINDTPPTRLALFVLVHLLLLVALLAK